MTDFRTIAVALHPYVTDPWNLIEATDNVLAALARTAESDYSTHEARVQAALNSSEVIGHLRDGKKINAIKELRTLTSCGLKEAKDAVEDYRVDVHFNNPWS